ncbi:MAG: glutamate 5-kinase [Deltaproteobacteria bacterium]|nr:glutamate 5-kinase [Deltaproteobacteria bacterium]
MARARRLVLKVGSSVLAGDPRSFGRIARDVAAARVSGRAALIVSSGAIALGLQAVGCARRPTSIPLLQAAAAAGQPLLMRRWERAFARHRIAVAQVLLTHADFADRRRYLNARRALEALLGRGVVPVLNENDTVAVDEIRFGDNDQLAAMTTGLIGADLLVLLSDVAGLEDSSGGRVSVVTDIDREALPLVRRPRKPGLGSGGMASKLDAARRATLLGVPVIIARGLGPSALSSVLAGGDEGTLFLPPRRPVRSRKHWIGFTLRPRGILAVDEGAAAALRSGKSLLPSGVMEASGEFEAGDAVTIRSPSGADVARGLTAYGLTEVLRIKGLHSREIARALGYESGAEIIHHDDMVLL